MAWLAQRLQIVHAVVAAGTLRHDVIDLRRGDDFIMLLVNVEGIGTKGIAGEDYAT